MARNGITRQDVETAALELQGRGKNPTVDAVRQVLGTGSKSTIIQHLKTWKSQSEEAQGKLPPELLALVSGLWERLNSQAEQRIAEVELVSGQRLEECKKDLHQLQQENTQLKNKYHHSEEMLHAVTHAKATCEQQLLTLQQEHKALLVKQLTSAQQLEDQKIENNRLHALAANIQANLEHYQASAQQARAEQSLIVEKQQAEFQHRRAELQQQIAANIQQAKVFELKYIHTNNEYQQLICAHHKLQKTHDHLTQQFQDISRDAVLFKERYEQTQQQLHVIKIELSNNNKQCMEFEKSLAILGDKHERLQIHIQQSEDKIESLRHENLFLIQEKSQLEGYIKQLKHSEIGLNNATVATDITI